MREPSRGYGTSTSSGRDMARIITSRRIQIVMAASLAFLLALTAGSYGVARAVSSSDDASSFLRSSASSKLFAADGGLLADLHGEIDRDPVPLSRIPLSMQHAAIAIEDRRFY